MRYLTIDCPTDRDDLILDCFAHIDGQSYGMLSYPEGKAHYKRYQLVCALRKFADYIENAEPMKNDDIKDGREDVRKMYIEGRLRGSGL